MIPEEIRLSTTFCAVPAFIRVEPAINSRPVSTKIGNFADASNTVPGLLATPIVTAPKEPACCSAATVNGVVPLAATAITTSCGVSRAALICVTASSTSSSAPSMLVTNALSPPATMKRTRSLGQAKVGISSAPSWTATRRRCRLRHTQCVRDHPARLWPLRSPQ